ncbi:MAG: response regulator transcription factor [Chitinophagaceae bacterium]|nr:response regulator transcription factor [Chitinophagaceae bacterium]
MTATSIEEFVVVSRSRNHLFDSILVDVNVNEKPTSDDIIYLINLFPRTKVLVHTDKSDYQFIIESFKNGACAYIVKDEKLNGLYQAVKDVEAYGAFISPTAAKALALFLQSRNTAHRKNSVLTKREQELIQLVIKGLSYKEMASYLNISHFTVNHHLKKLYVKMDVSSKTELVYKLISGEGDYMDRNKNPV